MPIAATVLTAITVTHYLGAITCFGSSLMSLPVLALVLDIREARTIILLVGTLQVYMVLLSTWKDIAWREFLKMSLVAGLGLPVGIMAVYRLPEGLLFALVSLLLLYSGLSGLLPSHSTRRFHPAFQGAILFLGGIVHGAFISGGSALAVYARQAIPGKDAFRGTINLFWVISNSVMLTVLLLRRDGSLTGIPLLVPALLLATASTWLANRTAHMIRQETFVRLISVLMLGAALVTGGRALWH